MLAYNPSVTFSDSSLYTGEPSVAVLILILVLKLMTLSNHSPTNIFSPGRSLLKRSAGVFSVLQAGRYISGGSNPLCRAISYRQIEAAQPTFSEEAAP